MDGGRESWRLNCIHRDEIPYFRALRKLVGQRLFGGNDDVRSGGS